MNLAHRLSATPLILFLIVVTGMFGLYVQTMKHSFEIQLSDNVHDMVNSLSLLLVPTLTTRDKALLDSTVSQLFDPDQYSRVLVVAANGDVLSDLRSLENRERVPAWLTYLVEVKSVEASNEINSSGYGPVEISVVGNVDYAYQRLWSFSVAAFWWIVVGAGLVWGVALWSVSAFVKSLKDIRTQVELLADGSSTNIETRTAIPELAGTANAVNIAAHTLEARIAKLTSERDAYNDRAQRDPISGLLNRDGFIQSIKATSADQSGQVAGLLIVMEVAPNMKQTTGWRYDQPRSAIIANVLFQLDSRRGDTVFGRIADDAFALFQPNFDDGDGERWARSLERNLRKIGQQSLVSVVQAPHAQDPEQLLCAARANLDQCQTRTRRWFVDEGVGRGIVQGFRSKVERAISERTLDLTLSPVVRLPSGDTWFYDVLPRIDGYDHQNGWAVLQGSDLAIDLDRATLELALAHLAAKPRNRFAVRISSASFFSSRFAAWLGDTVDRAGLSGTRLMVEFTQMDGDVDWAHWKSVTQEWKKVGCGLAIGEIGEHLDALHYVKQINPPYVRLCEKLITSACETQNRTVIRFVTEALHRLRVKVVISGVDDRERLDLARNVGADAASGAFVGE